MIRHVKAFPTVETVPVNAIFTKVSVLQTTALLLRE